MTSPKYILFDTETTGLDKKDRIIQVGSIITDNTGTVEVFDELCYTEVPIHPEASKVHGISLDNIKDEKLCIETSFYKRLESLNTEDHFLIAHNMPFDLGMLKKEGFEPNINLIDTVRVTRDLIDDLNSYSLQDLRYSLALDKLEAAEASKFNKEIKAHDALGDVMIMKLLFEKLISILEERFPNENPVEKMAYITNTPKLIEVFTFGKHKGKKVKDVYEKNPGYIHWFLKQDDLDIDLKYTFDQLIGE